MYFVLISCFLVLHVSATLLTPSNWKSRRTNIENNLIEPETRSINDVMRTYFSDRNAWTYESPVNPKSLKYDIMDGPNSRRKGKLLQLVGEQFQLRYGRGCHCKMSYPAVCDSEGEIHPSVCAFRCKQRKNHSLNPIMIMVDTDKNDQASKCYNAAFESR